MNFNHLPLDMQIEIVKYNSNFRRINKTFYQEGYHMFKIMYADLPITLDEFLTFFKVNKNEKVCIYIEINDILFIKYIKYISFDNLYLIQTYYIQKYYYIYIKQDLCNEQGMICNLRPYLPSQIQYDSNTTFNIHQHRQFPKSKLDIINNHFTGTTLNKKLKKLVYLRSYLGPEGIKILDVLDTIFNMKEIYKNESCINYINDLILDLTNILT